MSESQMNDSTFSRLFIIMILAMTALTVLLVVLASFASSDVNARLDEQYELENTQSVAERIAPVGKFSAESVAAPIAVATAPKTAEEVYASCAACHDSGTLSAPIVGDVAGWAPRIAKGIEKLYSNAINGINNMPAKGGNGALSDAEVKAAVDYMVSKSK